MGFANVLTFMNQIVHTLYSTQKMDKNLHIIMKQLTFQTGNRVMMFICSGSKAYVYKLNYLKFIFDLVLTSAQRY